MPVKPRIVFMGTPDFAVSTLQILVENDYDIAAVITAPDRPAGRGMKLQESPVKKYAIQNGLRVLQPEKLKSEDFLKEYKALEHDLNIVVAFRMLPEVVWNHPPMGTFNLHASLLPQYRGAAPINWAIINGEEETGLTTFFINHEIDTGKMILQEKLPISAYETAGSLHDKMMVVGAELVLKTLKILEKGDFDLIDQSQVIQNQDVIIKSAPKIFKKDCAIDYSDTLSNVYNKIRGLSPYPAAYITLMNKADEELVLKVYDSEIEFIKDPDKNGLVVSDGKNFIFIHHLEGRLYLQEIQAPGKKRMPVKDFLRGFPLLTGDWRVKGL